MSVSAFSDKFLIKAAADYSYKVSHFGLYEDPVVAMKECLLYDFNGEYIAEIIENKPIERNNEIIQLRYILFKHNKLDEYALVYQGSDYEFSTVFLGDDSDWSNNLSNLAHLPLENYDIAKNEFKYLKDKLGYNITAVSGNSLGGGYALNLSKEYPNLRIIGLNPAPDAYGGSYFECENSTILLTSKDALSRLLLTEITRLHGSVEDVLKTSKVDKLTHIYGYKPVIVDRSLLYTDKNNIIINHTGAMIDYRDTIKLLFLDNKVFYTSKVMLNNPALKDFSKYLLKLPLNSFDGHEYIDFMDNYLYPNLIDVQKSFVDAYRHFPTIDNFMLFDVNSLEIINAEGIPLLNKGFKIDNKNTLLKNIKLNLSIYENTSNFLFKTSKSLIDELLLKKELTFNKKSLFVHEYNLKSNLDFNVIKQLRYFPIMSFVKFAQLIEQNWRLFRNFFNSLNKEFFLDNPEFKDEEVSSKYINIYSELLDNTQKIDKMNFDNLKVITSNISNLINNHSEYKSIQKYDSLEYLCMFINHDNLFLKQYEEVKDAVDNLVEEILVRVDDFVLAGDEIIDEFIDSVDSIEDQKSRLKLYSQLSNINEELDFRAFMILALYEFKDDFVHFLLRDSVAVNIQSNLLQKTELNKNLIALLLNVKAYLNNNYENNNLTYINDDIDFMIKQFKLFNALILKLF